jgi:transposase
MRFKRPPVKQRRIRSLYGRNWYAIVSVKIREGMTLDQIAEMFTQDGIPVSAPTLSRWIAHREEERSAKA